MTGIYIHVPFCERKCPYCAFYSVIPQEDVRERFTARIVEDISRFGERIQADTVYFGGGTPALLGAENIGRILSQLRQSFELVSPEITVECNPNSITSDAMEKMRAAGVNRLSVGVQSLDDGELEFLGRLHNSRQAQDTLINAAAAGFDNISADLMLGIRGQTSDSISDAVRRLKELGVKHISIYMIKVEQGTAFDSPAVRRRLTDDDETAQLYLAAVSACQSAGFEQYEISNFACPGFESRHNLKYWRCQEYLGFGPSAHSFYNGVRYCMPSNLGEYMKGCEAVITNPSPDRAEEYVMLGLRLNEGISLDRAASLGLDSNRAEKAASLASKLAEKGLCRVSGESVSLTPEGMLVSNSIIAAFLA